MKNIFYSTFFLVLFTTLLLGQEQWVYVGKVHFPDTDTGKVQPYLMAVDDNGRLYISSSKTTTVNARNAIFYADSSDTVLTKFIDYDENGDSDTLTGNIGAIRGIGTIGNNLIINANIPFQRVNNTLAVMYYYHQADTNLVEKFGSGIQGAGYGTYIHAVAVTKDSFVVTGITFNTSIRFYSFNSEVTTPSRGSWVPLNNYPLEPGGPHSAGFDVIRDAAVLPNGDYSSPETPFYTSRNSFSSSQTTGGIAIWTGGTQTIPENYVGTRVQDASGDLVFDRPIIYGITVDKNGLLWVAGIDSTRRWVKAFNITINFAEQVYELPGQFSNSNPDPNGAPMTSPTDVALSPDGLTAYVSDAGSKSVYKFKYMQPSNVEDDNSLPLNFELNQNFPNPFNPSTLISYNLSKSTNVKLIVTNSLGEVVATLVDGFESAGKKVVTFDTSKEKLTSAVYFYTIITENGSVSKKMVLMK